MYNDTYNLAIGEVYLFRVNTSSGTDVTITWMTDGEIVQNDSYSGNFAYRYIPVVFTRSKSFYLFTELNQ